MKDAVAPAARFCDVGEADGVKSGPALTVRVKDVGLVGLGLPVTVIVYEPVGVEDIVAMVSVLDAPDVVGVMDVGLKVHVAPMGRPEQESITPWAVPLVSVAVIVVEPELPTVTPKLLELERV